MTELERCRPWIEAALEYADGTSNFDDIADGIREGRMQLWPGRHGCIVTEIQVFPRKRVFNVFLAGGDLEQILDMEADAAAWAKAQGCDFATFEGRQGWQRVLPGWTLTRIVMRKEL